MNTPVVVLTTGKTTTTGVLAVLADTSVTGRDVATVFTSVAEPGRHFLEGATTTARAGIEREQKKKTVCQPLPPRKRSKAHPDAARAIRPIQVRFPLKFGMYAADMQHKDSGTASGVD
jgi:hypothetical protein